MTGHARVATPAAAVPVGGRRPLGLADEARCSFGLCRDVGVVELVDETTPAPALVCVRHVEVAPVMPAAVAAWWLR